MAVSSICLAVFSVVVCILYLKDRIENKTTVIKSTADVGNAFSELPIVVYDDAKSQSFHNNSTKLKSDGTLENVKDVTFITNSRQARTSTSEENRSILTASSLNAIIDVIDTRLASLAAGQTTLQTTINTINTSNTSGTYTPLIANGTGVASHAIVYFRYIRISNQILVNGRVTLTAVADSPTTTMLIYISPPVGGTGFTDPTAAVGHGSIVSDTYFGNVSVIGHSVGFQTNVNTTADIASQAFDIVVSFIFTPE